MRFQFSEVWADRSLGELMDFQNGLNAESGKYGRGIKFISVGDILENDYITYDSIKGQVDASEKEKKTFSVQLGDIVFQRSSETQSDIGRSNAYLDLRPCLFGGFVIRGRKKADYQPYFLKTALQSPTNRKKVVRLGAGAQHFNIGQESLKTVSICLPSMPEQKKIASLFMRISKRIEIQNKIIEELISLEESIIDAVFSQQENGVLSDFVEETSNRNKGNEPLTVFSVSNKLGFIPQSEQFEEKEVASANKRNYKVVSPSSFAYNPARINVGSIGFYSGDSPVIISPMYVCFTTRNIVPTILALFFKSKAFFKEMSSKLEGSVRQCLTFQGMKSIKLHVPSAEDAHWLALAKTIREKRITEEKILQNYLVQKHFLLRNLFI